MYLVQRKEKFAASLEKDFQIFGSLKSALRFPTYEAAKNAIREAKIYGKVIDEKTLEIVAPIVNIEIPPAPRTETNWENPEFLPTKNLEIFDLKTNIKIPSVELSAPPAPIPTTVDEMDSIIAERIMKSFGFSIFSPITEDENDPGPAPEEWNAELFYAN